MEEMIREIFLIIISVIVGGLITLKINNKTNSHNTFQTFKFGYFVKLHELLFDLATYVAGVSIKEKIDIEKSLVISRYLNVEFEFAKKIMNDFVKTNDEIVILLLLQTEAKEEISIIKSSKNLTDDNELYSDKEVRVLTQGFYSKRGEILEKIMTIRHEVSREMSKFS